MIEIELPCCGATAHLVQLADEVRSALAELREADAEPAERMFEDVPDRDRTRKRHSLFNQAQRGPDQ